MATAVVKQGTKDLCLWCDKPIIFGHWEFWKDDHLLVPEGPKYPGYRYSVEKDEKWEAENQAYENWREHKKLRGVLNQMNSEYMYSHTTWVHLLSETIEKLEDLESQCDPKNKDYYKRATPISWCSKMTNENGVCHRKAKEVVSDRYGSKQALCGIHLANVRKALKEAEEYEQARELAAWRRDRADELIRELAKYGIEAEQEFEITSGRINGSYTGKVVVDPEKLLEILEQNVEVFDAPSDG